MAGTELYSIDASRCSARFDSPYDVRVARTAFRLLKSDSHALPKEPAELFVFSLLSVNYRFPTSLSTVQVENKV